MSLQERIQKLRQLNQEGLLGELRQRFSFAKRELPDVDAVALAYAKLAAEELGRAAAELFGDDPDEAADTALSLILPDRQAALATSLVDEMLQDVVEDQVQGNTKLARERRRVSH